ncbi:hypothetical protein C0216_25645 [Streptomyces globosus]|uniref:Uncharacterized protein n=1 Tax=Streptomyces globosus TaxID=68209 RepID=A0A344U671_9ACTN|nr:hypothetical protein C0216_25645 [Streptomyces globosus]
MSSIRKARFHREGIPTPNGCRWCGDAQENHGNQWVLSVGLHSWEPPTAAQRLKRMKARRAERSAVDAGVSPKDGAPRSVQT